MSKFDAPPSPVIPDHPDDPRWPESREARCGRYSDYYSLFWRLQVINRAKIWARMDARNRRGS